MINKVLHFGIHPDQHYREQRQILVNNHISLILSGAVVAVIFMRAYVFNAVFLGETVLLAALFLIPLVFSSFSLTILSRIITCMLPTLAIWWIFSREIRTASVVEESLFDGIRIYLIALSIIPYLVFDRTRVVMLLLCIAPSFLSIVFYDSIVHWLGLDTLRHIPGGVDFKLMALRTFIAYVLVNSACYTLLALVAKNDAVNEQLIRELNAKTEQIKLQNLELQKSRQDLIKVNRDLERIVDEKMLDIKKQNQVLSNYAFTNAHKLRGPVARILGLINVSRLEHDTNYNWIFSKLEEETKDIDRVIRSISEDLHEAHQPAKEGDRRRTMVFPGLR